MLNRAQTILLVLSVAIVLLGLGLLVQSVWAESTLPWATLDEAMSAHQVQDGHQVKTEAVCTSPDGRAASLRHGYLEANGEQYGYWVTSNNFKVIFVHWTKGSDDPDYIWFMVTAPLSGNLLTVDAHPYTGQEPHPCEYLFGGQENT